MRTLKKGELLFKEGEKSRAMYLLQSGSIRLFLKKGDSNIEIDTIRPGQILGELAFLDGNPRSVSGEALTQCELTEISGPMFMDVINKAPEWLKILLKTVVGRLRAANTRVRQLETANVAIDYSDKDGGKRSSTYQYLSYMECTKVCMSLLLVGTRNGKPFKDGTEIDLGLASRYFNTVMGVPSAKVTGVLDILAHIHVASVAEENGYTRVYLKDLPFLEALIEFLVEENQIDSSKRRFISVRGLMIMELIIKFLAQESSKSPPKSGSDSNKQVVDIMAIKNSEIALTSKDPFRAEDVAELVKLGYATDLKIKANTEVFVTLEPVEFKKNYGLMQVVHEMRALNEQKRAVGKTGK